jgi:sugar phosphate isomerase/epimerase
LAKVTAISSLGWAHYTLYEALPRIAARGFSRVEIASFADYCFHFNFGSPTPPELAEMLREYDLTPICVNYDPGFHEAWNPDEVDACVAKWARKLPHLAEVGIPMMTMDFGVRNSREDQQYQLANAVKTFDRIGESAKNYGVRMLLEVPHLYGVMHGPEQVLWVFDRLSSDNVGALIDSSHWGIIGYDIDEFLSRLGSRLWHIHLRDSRGPDTVDFKQDLELTPGEGDVDFLKFAQVLDMVGYKGDVSLDFEYRDLTLGDIEREYDEGLRYLSNNGWIFPESVEIDRSECFGGARSGTRPSGLS